MVAEQRRFFPRRERLENGNTQHIFTAHCEKCDFNGFVRSVRGLPDEPVAERFRRLGWTLSSHGNRGTCPRCNGVEPKNKLANKFKVVEGKQPVLPAPEVAEQNRDKRRKQADAAIRKHLTVVPDVPQPEPEQPVTEAPAPIQAESTNPAIDKLANEVAGLKVAVEFLAEQVIKSDDLHKQQIEAIARIAPIVNRSIEVINYSHQNLRDTLKAVLEEFRESMRAPAPEPVIPESVVAKAVESLTVANEPVAKPKRKGTIIPIGDKKVYGQESVKSCPANSKHSRFYTTVRVPTAVLAKAKINPVMDRVFVEKRDGKVIVRKAPSGGIKFKKLSDLVGVLQVTTMGNVSFTHTKSKIHNDEIVLSPA